MPSETHPDCQFCPENGKVDIIAQDDTAYLVAARDRAGVIPGCFLIIPKIHIEDPDDLSDDWYRSVKYLRRFIPGWRKDSYNESFNFGNDAGQRTPHVHLWVILRESSDAPFGLAHFVVKR